MVFRTEMLVSFTFVVLFSFVFIIFARRHCNFSVVYEIFFFKYMCTLTVDHLRMDVGSRRVRVVRISVVLCSCQPLSCAPIPNLPIGPFSSVSLLICVRPSIDGRQHIGCTEICRCCTRPIRHLQIHSIVRNMKIEEKKRKWI